MKSRTSSVKKSCQISINELVAAASLDSFLAAKTKQKLPTYI
jgi:hypothetical protein